MKNKPVFLIIQILLVFLLLVGIFLIWGSLQSFETLATLFNQLASDGELESFTESLYQTLSILFALGGIFLVVFNGFLLARWGKTKSWFQGLPTRSRQFFSLLQNDTLIFLKDVKATIANQGWVINSALVGGMFIAMIVRLKNLDIPLGHDEAYMYNAFASRSFWHIVTNYHLPNNHVLLSIIIKIVTGIFGNHVWTLRFPTIITGMLIVPASYYFAKRFYSVKTGILSSILVAVFPILVQYSVLARGYIIIMLITLLLFTLGDYVRVNENRFAWLLIVLLSALGFFTIPIMLFPFGALYIWLIVSLIFNDTDSYKPKFDFLKYWLINGFSAAILTIILYAPIMVYSFDRFFGNGVIAPLGWDVFPITTWTRLRNTWTEWTASVPMWISLLGGFGFLVSLIFHKRFSKKKFPPQLAFFIWVLTMLLVRRPDMLPRFWLFLAAPVLIWAVAGIVEPLKRIQVIIGKNWDFAGAFIIIIFAIIFLQSIIIIPSLPARLRAKDDMELVTLQLKDYLHQGDLVTASTARLPAMRYYFNYYEIPRGHIRESGKFQRAFVIVDTQKDETLYSIAPKLGYDLPAIDMDTAQELVQFDYLTVYECYPAP
jgi:4-amino-4-deoxy-L-arabinose transferase-like glycosyltransferase